MEPKKEMDSFFKFSFVPTDRKVSFILKTSKAFIQSAIILVDSSFLNFLANVNVAVFCVLHLRAARHLASSHVSCHEVIINTTYT